MSYRIFLAAMALIFSSANCFSQVTISPPSPTELDTINVQIPLTQGYEPGSTNLSMASNKITFSFLSSVIAPSAPSLYTFNWPVGPLPAGVYQVEIRENQTVIGTTNFTVLPRPGNGPLYSHTDMWWNAAESGWGASLVQHGSGNIFGVFYIYAANGTATWYVLPGGHWTTGFVFQGDLYQTKGPALQGFDPSLVTVNRIGAATITFDADPTKASLSLTIDGQTIQKAITRMSY
jgi:hypothetical protein